ncbi:MAG: hypothetical protein ACKOHJ_05875 [Vulcanococcus sp.]
MAHRLLITAGLLLGSLTVAPAFAQTGWSDYTSNISEVDACNQAQYLMPEKAVVQQFVLRRKRTSDGTAFRCKVRWDDSAKAQPTYEPILLPSKIRQPILAGGWL